MGNELTKKYDKDKIHTASGGHECLWKIYQARVKSTEEQVHPSPSMHVLSPSLQRAHPSLIDILCATLLEPIHIIITLKLLFHYAPSSLLPAAQVSVFVLDLDDFKGLPKNEREQLFDIYRKVLD